MSDYLQKEILDKLGLDALPVDSMANIQSAKVEYVITNREDPLKTTAAETEVIRNLGVGDINSIYVTPAIETTNTRHSGMGVLWLGPVKPLFRGMHDVPTAGDNVALVWVENEPYYLGILNSQNSVQYNWNAIVLNKNLQKFKSIRGKNSGQGTIDGKTAKGVPEDVMYTGLGRLEKPYSEILDEPAFESDTLSVEEYSRTKGSVGDFILEGKFGNSIRLGSRNNSPNLTISNLRQKASSTTDNSNDVLETPQDGGLITFLSEHTIQDNFFYKQPWLPSCNIDNGKHDIFWDSDYKTNQMLITTDRLTLNSRTDTLNISSGTDVNIGSVQNTNIKSQGIIQIDCDKLFIGSGEPNEEEPLVLGTQLKELLEKIIIAIGDLAVAGTIGGMSTPVSAHPAYNTTLKPIINEFEQILSDKHFISGRGK